MSNRDITTTNGETFTYRQTCEMAHMIYLRHGRSLQASAEAWTRLMQNDTSITKFMDLLEDYCIGTAWMRSQKVA